MNIFLKEMGDLSGGEKTILIMDGAGWHKSKDIQVPENIIILFLPPYSPELNPVEKLWQYIKENTIRNTVYESLEKLKDVICSFVSSMSHNKVKSVCACNYLFN